HTHPAPRQQPGPRQRLGPRQRDSALPPPQRDSGQAAREHPSTARKSRKASPHRADLGDPPVPWQDLGMEEQAAPVTVERIGPRRYTARNNRGGQVEIGGPEVEGVFRPGELLAVALGACNAMTADIPIGRRLGEDFEATVTVRPTKDTEENRYTRAEVEMVLGAAAADRLDEITKVADRKSTRLNSSHVSISY